MIIVMTNRNLVSAPQTAEIEVQVKKMGLNLGSKIDGKDRLFTGIFLPDEDNTEQYNKITFYPKGAEKNVFKNIPKIELEKPWVFFVHGFHQDPVENIEKVIALQNNHKVNVIVFAWPSRPLDKTIGWSDVGKNAAMDALKGMSPIGIATKQALNYAKAALADRWENYFPAQANARQSDIDLMAALGLVKDHLKSAKPPVLLVHSMGNYLLECCLKKVKKLPMNFSHIMLHQADVTVPDYKWVNKLKLNLINKTKSNLYITTNLNDSVLLASKGRRAILKLQGELASEVSTERLGRYIGKHIAGNIRYLDFTCGPDVDDKHEFFKFPDITVNKYIYACLNRIFKGNDDGLPAKVKSSESGFSKMPMKVNVYRLEYVYHLVDYIEDNDDAILVTSLSQFDSGKGLKYEDDPDFDDYG